MSGVVMGRLLRLLGEGGIRSTAELARRLDISEGLVGLMMEDLTRRGYLAYSAYSVVIPHSQGCKHGRPRTTPHRDL